VLEKQQKELLSNEYNDVQEATDSKQLCAGQVAGNDTWIHSFR